ncbi:unnamed protein product [Staurois parvus]|uniref:Uncharacterized protein n=1 Tax=Staurois parvus TaxID=386267 RepID=A0ABN9D5K6_9NEOB|nr:unnamed protein product [Staurois parvus]
MCRNSEGPSAHWYIPFQACVGTHAGAGGLTIWKNSGTARGPGVSRRPHGMPLVTFS